MRWRLGNLTRSTQLALLAGGLGFAWTFLVAVHGAVQAFDRPTAEDQKPFVIPGDTAYGDWKPVWRRLKGWPTASGKGDRKPCWPGGDAIWLDEKPLVRGAGPRNGVTVTYWVSKTMDSEVYLGRYETDLWYQDQASTGAGGFVKGIQNGDNTRFIERIPPPSPGPPGWRVIMPGQCAWGDVRPLDDEGTMGRFLVDLPAEAVVYRNCGVDEGESVSTECVLTLDGKEAAHVAVDGALDGYFRYKTERAGRYGIIVRRTDVPNGHRAEDARASRFSLMITWGPGGGTHSCNSPTYDSNCF